MFLKKIPFYQENKGQALIRLEYSLTKSTNLNEKYKFGKHHEKKLLSLLVIFFFPKEHKISNSEILGRPWNQIKQSY